MARQRVKTTVKTTTTKKRVRKTGGDTGMEKCHICHGKGVVPKRKKNA